MGLIGITILPQHWEHLGFIMYQRTFVGYVCWTRVCNAMCWYHLGPDEAGCIRQVVAALQMCRALCGCVRGQGRLAALGRWLPHTVTTIDRSH